MTEMLSNPGGPRPLFTLLLMLATFMVSFQSDPSSPRTRLSYREIPVLCYHNIKKSPTRKDLLRISEADFDDQMQWLHGKGYHTILPDQLYQYLTKDSPLPAFPMMLTFDDGHAEHFSVVKPILDKYGFKGVFFVMTVCVDKPGYLTQSQIKQLAEEGHAIESHTWDHRSITSLQGPDWQREIDHPGLQLAKITGRPVEFFAYPYGVWDETSILELKKRNIKGAFQLTGKLSTTEPLFTIRRLMVSGSWSPLQLETQIKRTFTN